MARTAAVAPIANLIVSHENLRIDPAEPLSCRTCFMDEDTQRWSPSGKVTVQSNPDQKKGTRRLPPGCVHVETFAVAISGQEDVILHTGVYGLGICRIDVYDRDAGNELPRAVVLEPDARRFDRVEGHLARAIVDGDDGGLGSTGANISKGIDPPVATGIEGASYHAGLVGGGDLPVYTVARVSNAHHGVVTGRRSIQAIAAVGHALEARSTVRIDLLRARVEIRGGQKRNLGWVHAERNRPACAPADETDSSIDSGDRPRS